MSLCLDLCPWPAQVSAFARTRSPKPFVCRLLQYFGILVILVYLTVFLENSFSFLGNFCCALKKRAGILRANPKDKRSGILKAQFRQRVVKCLFRRRHSMAGRGESQSELNRSNCAFTFALAVRFADVSSLARYSSPSPVDEISLCLSIHLVCMYASV